MNILNFKNYDKTHQNIKNNSNARDQDGGLSPNFRRINLPVLWVISKVTETMICCEWKLVDNQQVIHYRTMVGV